MAGAPARAPVVGLLLAGGRGSRFDGTGARNKLLAPIDGEPVVAHAARRLAAATDHCVAVIRPGVPGLREALAPWVDQVVECPEAASGMGHTMAFGAAHARDGWRPRAVLVALGDMPFVAPATLARLVACADDDAVIAVPRHGGERGHPVLFGRAHLDALTRLDGDRGAAALLRDHPVRWIDVDDPGIVKDIDRPSDLPG